MVLAQTSQPVEAHQAPLIGPEGGCAEEVETATAPLVVVRAMACGDSGLGCDEVVMALWPIQGDAPSKLPPVIRPPDYL